MSAKSDQGPSPPNGTVMLDYGGSEIMIKKHLSITYFTFYYKGMPESLVYFLDIPEKPAKGIISISSFITHIFDRNNDTRHKHGFQQC